MAIPQAIIDVINLAKAQEAAETLLESFKAQKTEKQTAIAELNIKITDQVTVVQNARAALRAAALLI